MRTNRVRQDTFIGREIGEFIVQERIRAGTRSVVYRAFQPSANRDVALKLTRIDDRKAQDEAFQQQLAAAAEPLTEMEHPAILPTYTYGTSQDAFYTAMRLNRGDTLQNLLADTPIPDLSLCVQIITQVGEALHHANQHGVFHYDLKPASVLLDEAKNAHLTDFGLAKRILNEGVISSKEALTAGDFRYLSPEHLQDEPLSPRSDVFMLGMLLYRMAAGELPHEEQQMSIAEAIHQQVEDMPPSPRTLNPQMPTALEAIIMKAIARDPGERYANPKELITVLQRDLQALFAGPTAPEVPTPAQAAPLEPQPDVHPADTMRRLVPASLGLTVLIVVGALLITFINPPVPAAVVVRGEIVAAEALAPTNGTLSNARRSLRRADGFIAYISCNSQSAYHTVRVREIQARAERYNLPLRVYDSAGAPELEIQAVQQATADGAAAIVQCVVGPTTIAPLLSTLDMPLIVDDVSLLGELREAVFIAENDYELGYTSGQAAGEYIQTAYDGQADVLLLTDPSRDVYTQRASGLLDGLQAAAPEAALVGRYLGADVATARATMGSLIGNEVDFDVVLTVTDDSAYGVVQALDFAGYLPHEVAIFSIGADRLAQQYILDGHFMQASARPDRAAISHALVDAAVVQLGGGIVAQRILPEGDLFTAESAATDG